MWKRKGYYYYAYLSYKRGPYSGTVEKKLGFFAYHLIRYFHGDEGLREMAIKSAYLDKIDWDKL